MKNKGRSILLIIFVILSAISITVYLIISKPKVKKRTNNNIQKTKVKVMELKPGKKQVTIDAMGTVAPAQSIKLRARVAGSVVWLNKNAVPGGILKKGDVAIKLDRDDYSFLVDIKKSDVVRAQMNLKIEDGLQKVALKEYGAAGRELKDNELVLRKPQLKSVKANLAAAKAALAKAELDLKRTLIKTPFNAIIQEKTADLGTTVAPSTNMLSLIGTDQFWVTLSVPVDYLKWIKIPDKENPIGSHVKLYSASSWGSGVYRDAAVIRIAPDLEKEGRLAKVIVSVKDPLSLKKENVAKPKLLVGMYLKAKITGRYIENSIALARAEIREGETIYLLETSKLDIKKVDVVFRNRESIFINGEGLSGALLILDDIANPAPGMELYMSEKIDETVRRKITQKMHK